MIILANVGNTLGNKGKTRRRKTNKTAATVVEAREKMYLTQNDDFTAYRMTPGAPGTNPSPV